jgi:hypothetical protein
MGDGGCVVACTRSHFMKSVHFNKEAPSESTSRDKTVMLALGAKKEVENDFERQHTHQTTI